RAGADPAAGGESAEKGQRTKTPMVTIVTSPPGALVEINGVLFGNTPVIMPSPAATDHLSVKLVLDRYKKWEGEVTANEAGHFSLNVKLERTK
ncbi:PEGA domain-containing protein, partial [Myxococcota bacterium]|nr:PEGA domain-containing protein [Myxococcota bacterium]